MTQRDENTGQFLQGSTGNPKGRPRGARSRLGEQFLAALQHDFEAHGADAIARVRAERPHDYLKIIASLLPKDLNFNIHPVEEMTDDELGARIRELTHALRPFLYGDADDEDGLPCTVDDTLRH